MKALNPAIECKDGFTMSVQGSEFNYALPRVDNPPNGYTHVECGFPSSTPVTSALLDHCGGGNATYTEAVYPYTPVEVVQAELDAHGGIATGCLPS